MNYKNYNDYELIYMVRENDVPFDLLFEKYMPILRKLSSVYYMRYSSYGYDYEDFLQEACIAFQRAINKYDDNIYLIDMARGFRSAYFDNNKI